jgi:DNA-binding transcriptional ArsR family regulator
MGDSKLFEISTSDFKPPPQVFADVERVSALRRESSPSIYERNPTRGELTELLTASLVPELKPTALAIYRALHETALHVAQRRGYAPRVSQVSFHIPAEIVAYALSIHRSTLYAHLPTLKERGLLDYRAHRTTHNGRTVADGTVWSVKVDPRRAPPARIRFDDLKHKWRDLGADVEAGRTAYATIRQSGTEKEGKVLRIPLLLSWALPGDPNQTPLFMTVGLRAQGGPETVLDVPHAAKAERGQMVDLAARSLCQYLGDDSINFYRWILWRFLRLYDQGQDYFAPFHTMILRAGADHREGFARSAGALLVSRLKRWEVWGVLRVER